jgi:TetR/AcrR family transcriptional regulator
MRKSSPKSERTRVLILKAATEVVAKKGFDNATYQAIADRAGIHQTSIFYYFKDREELVFAVLEGVVERSRVWVDQGFGMQDSADVRLLKHFMSTFDFARENPEDARIFLLMYYYGAHSPEFGRTYSAVLAGARRRIETILHAGVRERCFELEFSPERTAELLHDLLLGGVVNFLASRQEEVSVEALKGKYARFLRSIVGGEDRPLSTRRRSGRRA